MQEGMQGVCDWQVFSAKSNIQGQDCSLHLVKHYTRGRLRALTIKYWTWLNNFARYK
jgi:hypothetical protein